MAILFITGIDTNIGKTYVTGLLGYYLLQKKKKIITSKLVQTGDSGIAEDIKIHRTIMQMALTPFDKQGLTCPYVFKFASSPHLAAKLEKKTISLPIIDKALSELEKNFELVLLEGAGGIYVPLHKNYTTLDFIAERKYPCLVVSSPKLGSINHTLLTLAALQNKKITIKGILYNLFFEAANEIKSDTSKIFKTFFPKIPIINIPTILSNQTIGPIDFSSLEL